MPHPQPTSHPLFLQHDAIRLKPLWMATIDLLNLFQYPLSIHCCWLILFAQFAASWSNSIAPLAGLVSVGPSTPVVGSAVAVDGAVGTCPPEPVGAVTTGDWCPVAFATDDVVLVVPVDDGWFASPTVACDGCCACGCDWNCGGT